MKFSQIIQSPLESIRIHRMTRRYLRKTDSARQHRIKREILAKLAKRLPEPSPFSLQHETST